MERLGLGVQRGGTVPVISPTEERVGREIQGRARVPAIGVDRVKNTRTR